MCRWTFSLSEGTICTIMDQSQDHFSVAWLHLCSLCWQNSRYRDNYLSIEQENHTGWSLHRVRLRVSISPTSGQHPPNCHMEDATHTGVIWAESTLLLFPCNWCKRGEEFNHCWTCLCWYRDENHARNSKQTSITITVYLQYLCLKTKVISQQTRKVMAIIDFDPVSTLSWLWLSLSLLAAAAEDVTEVGEAPAPVASPPPLTASSLSECQHWGRARGCHQEPQRPSRWALAHSIRCYWILDIG